MAIILDHTKQYACPEVFRLVEMQDLAQSLEDASDQDENARGNHWQLKETIYTLTELINDAAGQINEFLKNLEEQEKR